jgi:opacity protein-like surface antigen
MKKFILASVVAIAFAGPALAADLAPSPEPVYKAPYQPVAYDWTGFYLGGFASYSWARTPSTVIDTGAGATIGTTTTHTSAFHGGGEFGFDYMLPSRIVVGVVTDVSTGESQSSTNTDATGTVMYQNKVYESGTVRARLGYAIDRLLLYGTGGWAWSLGQVTRTQVAGTAGMAGPGTSEPLDTGYGGWTAGGGLAFAVLRNLNVFAEYRYTRFGISNNFAISQRMVNSTLNGNLVEVGLNYKLDWSPNGCPWYRRSC